MTPAEFKALKPQFAGVANPTVQGYLDMAARLVFDDEDMVLAAYTCHLMTLDGLGTDAASADWRSGRARYQTIRSGQLTLTRFQAAYSGSSYLGWLDQTACGQFYAMMLRMARSGPRIARGGGGPGRTAYAKDGWPLWVDNGYP